MLVVLSQRIDFDSEYSDELFKIYHYPSRYRNMLREGDSFVYYQGNRYDKTQRYYYGVGTVAQISTTDGINYDAILHLCKRFGQKVPIYLPDGGYIEQLNYQEVRKSLHPPWQSSIRPISEQAYDYILDNAGEMAEVSSDSSLEEMKARLKKSVRNFFLEKDDVAVLEIGKAAAAISVALNLHDCPQADNETVELSASSSTVQVEGDAMRAFIAYCMNMKMSYSYKPVLVMAMLELHDEEWNLSITQAADYFRTFYRQRREAGLVAETKKCIYQNPSVTSDQIVANLLANPVKALVASGFFGYDAVTNRLALWPDLKMKISERDIEDILIICKKRLKQYYSRYQG